MSPRLIVPLLAAALALAGPARAAEPPPLTGDYRISSWSGGDGITLGEIRSIAQDGAGYLWLATAVGLVRFDGLRFNRDELVASPDRLPASPVRAVYAARDGTLWVGYGRGHGVYRLRGERVLSIHLRDGIGGLVNVIREDRTGAVWVGHDAGLASFKDGTWTSLTPIGLSAAPRVFDLLEDADGSLWVATDAGLFRRRPGGPLEAVSRLHETVFALSRDARGRLWMTDDRAGVVSIDGAPAAGGIEVRGRSLFHDSRGNLWLTTNGQGVLQFPAGNATEVRRVTARMGLRADENACVFEDRDGNLWVGSINGLSRLTPHRVESMEDLGAVRALTIDTAGTAWVGTTTGLLTFDARAPAAASRRLVRRANVLALHTAPDGELWVATTDGLLRGRAGVLTPADSAPMRLRAVTSMTSDATGTLWAVDRRQGLVTVRHGRLERVGVSAGVPTLVAASRRGELWLALPGGVVRRIDAHGNARDFSRRDGLPHAAVYVIYEDSARSLWVGGTEGLSRLVGDRFETLSFHDEPLGRGVASVIDDDQGDLWAGLTYYGFIRVARADLTRAFTDPAHISRYRVYDTSAGSGYPDVTLRQPLVRGPDHRLWSVTTRGLTILDPPLLRDRRDGDPGPARIEGITADEVRYQPGDGLRLPPRTTRVGVDYTVVNLSSDERIRFRYRLDGFDADWVDGTGRRRASYTNLPPRTYRFRLQTSTTAAEWSDSEVSWSFSIAPTFYQTPWFAALVVSALALAVAGAWQLRLRQLQRQFTVVMEERLRLSRLIHDTLLQSLYATALQIDFASTLADDGPSLRHHLGTVRKQIEDYISDARGSIFQLRTPLLERQDLASALRGLGERLTHGRVAFELRVSGHPRRCPDAVETNALRIGHEAVMNAVRHAGARHIAVELAYQERLLRLCIEDDGRGFDTAGAIPVSPPNHFGLESMRERAEAAGGRCSITSAPGAGVRVEAEFPLEPLTAVS